MSRNNREGKKDDGTKAELPYPYLRIEYPFSLPFSAVSAPCMDGEIAIIQRDLYEGDSQQETFKVTNLGNFPAWTCYIEAYNASFGCGNRLSSFERVGRQTISLQPSESHNLTFSWTTRYPGGGAVVGICHDPILDPLVRPFRSIIVGPYEQRQLAYIQFAGGNR
jgi:hypothetical protein